MTSAQPTKITPGLYSFLDQADANEDINNITPGFGMPASYTDGKQSSKWRAMPVTPLNPDGRFQSAGGFDPTQDDAIYLPPSLTLEAHRKSILTDASTRPMSDRSNGFNKNTGYYSGIDYLVNPPVQRTGIYKPTGYIPFGITDQYYAASTSDNYGNGIDAQDAIAQSIQVRNYQMEGNYNNLPFISLSSNNASPFSTFTRK